MFENVEVTFVSDIDSAQSKLGWLPTFAQALNDVCSDQFVLFIGQHNGTLKENRAMSNDPPMQMHRAGRRCYTCLKQIDK